ncbi:hypothetical protein H6769_01880 [Candidatus Peribacteria bacterium]|nr:hypothetical protein [Candidatus Peribacteria bacterium]
MTTDLSIESKDGKFEYKLPKNGRINILGTGITGGIPYVVESPKNAEVSKDVVKSTIILESYQVPQVNLEGNGNSLRARITFRDATPAERSVIEKHDKITDDARKKLV